MEEAYAKHLTLLELINIKPKPEEYLNLNFGVAVDQQEWSLMTRKALNDWLNRVLARFGSLMSAKYNPQIVFSTHGFRYGYVSELILKKVPLEQISRMGYGRAIVGHASIVTTQGYNKT